MSLSGVRRELQALSASITWGDPCLTRCPPCPNPWRCRWDNSSRSNGWGRAIDATQDIEALRELTKQLVRAWFCQKAATLWAIRQQATPAEVLVKGLSEGELLGFGDDGVDLAGTLG